jgi:hypothetical protein
MNLDGVRSIRLDGGGRSPAKPVSRVQIPVNRENNRVSAGFRAFPQRQYWQKVLCRSDFSNNPLQKYQGLLEVVTGTYFRISGIPGARNRSPFLWAQ